MIKYMCKYPGCCRMVNTPNTYCEAHAKAGAIEDARKADAKAARKPFAERIRENEWMYHTPQYRKARAYVLSRDRCCVLCGSGDKLTADHDPPARPGCTLDEFCDPEGMRTLCKKCHDALSGYDGGKRQRMRYNT